METEVVVVHAERAPMKGVANPGPHQIYKNPQISVEQRTLQELAPNKIRVQMLYAGLCGTDVHLAERIPETGYIRSSAPAEIPGKGRVIGHEGVGRILKTGANVRHLQAGAIVTFESIIVCHYCDVCRKGHFNQCRNAKLLGLEKDGIFGTTVDVEAMLAHDVTDLVQDEQDLQSAACVEPAGVAYVACQNTRVKGGDAVLIFGAGPIGLFAAMFSKLIFGASSVHIVEPVPFRRQFARQWCDYVYTPEEFFAAPPSGVDVAIEASGFLENVNKVFRQVNANGRIAFLARSGMPLTLDAVDHMITNAVQLMGSRGHLCGAFTDILRLYRENKIPLHDLVTTVLNGPAELAEFMQNSDKIFNENCKVLVRLS
ncbi:MAG: alcohol dehydrogenase [Candidatus Electrothrix sp. ATG1]|nr:alcohol dehydrogenase [Candidatus Electrothrix sp. ATG1]